MTLRSEIRRRPVFQRILYAQGWEDPAVDLQAMQVGPTDDVFAIGAAGDSAFAFLLAEPHSLLALDFNLSQCCLIELKAAALAHLSYGQLLAFIGVLAAEDRGATYRQLRDQLGDEARRYWDDHPELIGPGVIHIGKFENYFAKFRRYVLRFTHTPRIVRKLLEPKSAAEQRVFYDRYWDNWRWRALFKIFFSRTLMGALGRDPAMFKYVEGNVGAVIMERARYGLAEIPVANNWFLDYIATGSYSPPLRLPPYLREDNQPKLRRLLDRMRIVNDEIEAFLPQSGTKFSCFYLSDIFEYMDEAAATSLFNVIAAASTDGARLSCREMMVPRPPPTEPQGLFVRDDELSDRCHRSERAFFYGAHHAVTIHKTEVSK